MCERFIATMLPVEIKGKEYIEYEKYCHHVSELTDKINKLERNKRENCKDKLCLKGFAISLPDFCFYCGEFEPEIERIEISDIGDGMRRFSTEIHCVNEAKCLHIASMLKERLKNG